MLITQHFAGDISLQRDDTHIIRNINLSRMVLHQHWSYYTCVSLLFPPRVCVAFVLSDTTVWQVSTEPVLPLYHREVFRPDFGGRQDFLQFYNRYCRGSPSFISVGNENAYHEVICLLLLKWFQLSFELFWNISHVPVNPVVHLL